MKINEIYSIQPLSVAIETITLYQDEKIKILEMKNEKVKFLRLKTNEILEVPKMAIKIAIG